MQENVIFLLCDELAEKVFSYRLADGTPVVPFLSELRKKSISASRMYSQGPYTEAAIRGLYNGYSPLSHLKTILKPYDIADSCLPYLEQNGYEVNTYSWMLYSGRCGLPLSGYQIDPTMKWCDWWTNRFNHYQELAQQGSLSDADVENCRYILDFALSQQLDTCGALLRQEPCTRELRRFVTQTPAFYKAEIAFCAAERAALARTPRAYLEALFAEKGARYLQRESLQRIQYMPDALRSYEVRRYNETLRRLKEKSRRLNRRNTHIPAATVRADLRMICRGRCREGLNNLKLLAVNYYLNLLRESHGYYYTEQETIAADKVLMGKTEPLLAHLRGRDRRRPYFALIHCGDVHGPATFMNPFLTSKEAIDEEMALAAATLDNLPPDFRGSLNYIVSARILDFRIERFVHQLEAQGLLDDHTSLIVTADHGTSYLYDPIRQDMVNNFYDTQYHVPFLLYRPGIRPQRIDEMTYSKDILATLLPLLGLAAAPQCTGANFLSPDFHREYVIHEYMGGYCPDYLHRPARLCIRSAEYKVTYYAMLTQPFEAGRIVEIHDLRKDPQELDNLVYSRWDSAAVQPLLEALKQRFAEIRRENAAALGLPERPDGE